MPSCSTCGNDYDKAFKVVTAAGEEFHFDSLECAAQRIAPRCEHCDCTILGHGIQTPKGIYCCAHCARDVGESRAVDNTTRAASASR